MRLGGPPFAGKTTLWLRLLETGTGYVESDSVRVYVFLQHGLKIRKGEKDHDIWQGWKKDHPRHELWSQINEEHCALLKKEVDRKDILVLDHGKEPPFLLEAATFARRTGTEENNKRAFAAIDWLATTISKNCECLTSDQAFERFKGLKGIPTIDFTEIVNDAREKKEREEKGERTEIEKTKETEKRKENETIVVETKEKDLSQTKTGERLEAPSEKQDKENVAGSGSEQPQVKKEKIMKSDEINKDRDEIKGKEEANKTAESVSKDSEQPAESALPTKPQEENKIAGELEQPGFLTTLFRRPGRAPSAQDVKEANKRLPLGRVKVEGV